MLLVTARVRRFAAERGKQVSQEALTALDRHVAQALERAIVHSGRFARISAQEVERATQHLSPTPEQLHFPFHNTESHTP